MHLYFYVRGINANVEENKKFLEHQYFKLRYTDPDGNERTQAVQGMLRQSVLGVWEYVFPKEALPEVLGFMGYTPGKIGVSYTGLKRKKFEARLAVLRGILGAKKIPKDVKNKVQEFKQPVPVAGYERVLPVMPKEGVSYHIIGIKEDRIKTGKDGLTYERI